MTILEILKVESPDVLQLLIEIFKIEDIENRQTTILEPTNWKREMVTDSDDRYLGYSSRAMKL